MDYVLHQAAIPSVPRSVKDPVTSNRANIDASLNVLVAARDAGVKRLVYAGLIVGLRRHADAAQARGHAAEPALAVRAAEAGGRAVLPDVHAALRLRDGDHPLLQRVRAAAGSRLAVLGRDLAVCDGAARAAGSRSIYGDGEQTRDFTYVANVVDGVLRACEAPKAAGEVINVATGGRISLNELLRTMNRIVGTRHRGRSTRSRAPATCATRRPTSARRERSSATSRASASKTVCAGPWSGARRPRSMC